MGVSTSESFKPFDEPLSPWHDRKVQNGSGQLTQPSDLALADLGSKFSQKACNSYVIRYWRFGGAARRRFSAILEKPEEAYFAPPPPVRVFINFWIILCPYLGMFATLCGNGWAAAQERWKRTTLSQTTEDVSIKPIDLGDI